MWRLEPSADLPPHFECTHMCMCMNMSMHMCGFSILYCVPHCDLCLLLTDDAARARQPAKRLK